MAARSTSTYLFFYSSHVFWGFSRSLRGPNLGMVIRGLVSSPLLHGAAAGRLSLSLLPSLSPPRTTCSVSLRAAHVRIYFTGWQRDGYLSAPNLGSLNYFRSTLTARIFDQRRHANGKRMLKPDGFVLLVRSAERIDSRIYFACSRTPAEINLSPLFNAQFLSHPDKSIASCPWRYPQRE